MLTATVRDLHACYPGRFLTDVRTPCPDLWLHTPHAPLQRLLTAGPRDLEEDRCGEAKAPPA